MSDELSDRDLLLAIYARLGNVEGKLSMWRWIFGSTVLGGVGWLSWLTLTLIGVLT